MADGSQGFRRRPPKIGEFTLEGRAKQIECPMLVGYSKDDRIMDPAGALKLYEEGPPTPSAKCSKALATEKKKSSRSAPTSPTGLPNSSRRCEGGAARYL